MTKNIDFAILNSYLPEKGIEYIEKWLSPYWFHLVIKKPRNTKLGDYRYPIKGHPHKITVNADLSKFLCFFTLTHEIAHLIAFDRYSTQIQPHGKEWKKVFSGMILESLDLYKENSLKEKLLNFIKNPKASFYADPFLAEYFLKQQNPNILLLKDLPFNIKFELNQKVFYKLERMKTRYICTEKKTNKKYYIAGSVPVKLVNYGNRED